MPRSDLAVFPRREHHSNLQVVDGPDTECNGQSDTTEGEDENWSIATIQSRSNTVADLLGVPTSWSGALRTTEAGTLLLKVHSSAFLTLVNVSAVLTDPFSLPVLGCQLFLAGLLRSGLLLSEDVEAGGGCRWCGCDGSWGDWCESPCEAGAQGQDEDDEGSEALHGFESIGVLRCYVVTLLLWWLMRNWIGSDCVPLLS
mmetsp:Transcript_14745/g.40786  ORF Transcript_14745/g.40786 Transcript_14745/m.40786 type:complete len:200 (+) Transcript_14745:219-818(+)